MITTQLSKILPIIYAIIGFGVLVLVHEFGHFIFCKMFGVHTPNFSIGFGPKIIQKKIGTTNFCISALPLGGYVEIAGLQEVGQGEQKHAQANDKTAFSSKPYWQKFLILTGGVSFNLLFSYLALIILFMVGAPTKPEIKITSVQVSSLAANAGILTNDIVLKINNIDINKNPDQFTKEWQKIQKLENKEIVFTISRDDEEIKEIKILLPSLSKVDSEKKGRLGIVVESGFSKERTKYPFIKAIKKGIKTTNEYIVLTLKALKTLIKNRSLKGVGGPVLIFSQGTKLAKQGFVYLLIFLAIISISLAIMNLIPIPALDGGQLVFVTIESIIGKEIPISIKNVIHLASIALLLALFLYITYRDILLLIKK
jgi:regulator of sigma E protease